MENKERTEARPAVALAVPYGEKGEAKAAGAIYVADAKAWAIPEGADPGPFSKWVPDRAAIMSSGAGPTPEAAFAAALAEAGFETPDPRMDGKFHHGRVEGDRGAQKSGSYIFHADGGGASWYMKDHRAGVETTGRWNPAAESTPPEIRAALRLQSAIDRAARDAAEAERRERSADVAAARWEALQQERPEGTYLDRKGVGAHGDIRFDGTDAILPYRDAEGKIWTLQTIPAAEGRAKLYMKDARKEGCFFATGRLENGKTILVAEGYATAASLAELTGHTAVAAGDAGSLERVCQDLRARYPASLMVVCPDNDMAAVAAGKPNRGLDAGIDAANACGGHLAVPEFPEGTTGSDWNDLVAGAGRLAARGQIDWLVRQASFKVCDDLAERMEAALPGLPVEDAELGSSRPTAATALEVAAGWCAMADGETIRLFRNETFRDGPPPLGERVTIAPEAGFVAWAPTASVSSQDRLAAVCGRASGGCDEAAGLIADGADPGAPGTGGMTPLHLAAASGNAGMASLLAEAGADVAARDDKGRTPLHWAAFRGHIRACEALVVAGADANAMDGYGATPARSAGLGGKPGAAAWLVGMAWANPEDARPMRAKEAAGARAM